MGYRSDVWVGMIVQDEEDAMKLIKAYSAMPKVKENKILELWQIAGDPTNGRVLFLYEDDWVKWYDSYESVQAIKEITNAACYAEIEYAYREVVFGEETEDITDHIEVVESDDKLSDAIWRLFSVSRVCDVDVKSKYESSVPTLDTYKMFAA